MKKFFALLLTLCMVLTLLPVTAMPVSAEETITITVGVISYVMNTQGIDTTNGWQVRYGEGLDADCTPTGKTVQKYVAEWSSEQTFTVFTAEIPSDAQFYKVHHGDWWFGQDNTDLNKTYAFVFNYSGDKANYYRLEDGYYLNYGKEDAEWAISTLTADERLHEDSNNSNLFVIEHSIPADKNFKVVEVRNDSWRGNDYWYGDSNGNNFHVLSEGNYTVKLLKEDNNFTVTFDGFTGAGLTLKDGIIDLKFEDKGIDNTYTVDFDGPNGVAESKTFVDGIVSYPVYYKDYDVPVVATLKKGNETVTTYTVSVEDYITASQNSTALNDNEKAVVRALEDLCVNVKAHFKTTDTRTVSLPDNYNTDDYAIQIKGDSGCYYGMTLLMEDAIKLRLYFKNPGDATLQVDGVDAVWTGTKGVYKYYDFTRLSASALGEKHSVKVIGDNGVEITSVCALSYAVKALDAANLSEALPYCAAALFLYRDAAVVAFPS